MTYGVLTEKTIRQLQRDHLDLRAAFGRLKSRAYKQRDGGGDAGTSIRIGRVPAGQQITAATGTTPGSGQVQPWRLSGGTYADDGSPVTVNNPWSAVIPENTVVAYQDDDNRELIAADCDTGPELIQQQIAGPVAITGDSANPPWTDTGLDLVISQTGLFDLAIAFTAEHTLGNNQTVAGRAQFSIGGPPSGTGAGTPLGGVLQWGFGRQSTFASFPVSIPTKIDAGSVGTADLYATNMGDGTLNLVSLRIQQYGPLT